MIHTTQFGSTNRTVNIDNVDLIVAPTTVHGDWVIQVVFQSGHVTAISYDLGRLQTPAQERDRLKQNMWADHDALVAALEKFHYKRSSNLL